MRYILVTIILTKLSVATCLVGYKADPAYPGPADWTIKIWNENLFTAQVMRILLNDVLEQDVEFFDRSTDVDQILTDIAGIDRGFDSKTAVFWYIVSELSLPILRNTSEYSSKFMFLPLGSGAPVDYYKVFHPGLALELPYISHLLTLVNFPSDRINETYFITYNSAEEAYNASCGWLQENTDLVTLWTPWVDYKNLNHVILYILGTMLMIISFVSFTVLWLILRGIDTIQNSFRKEKVGNLSRAITKRWIKAGDVYSLAGLCVGCWISGTIVFLVNRTTNFQCNFMPFIMHGGFLIVIGSLTVRTDKLVRIFNIASGQSIKIQISFWNTWFAWIILPALVVFSIMLLCLLLIPLESKWVFFGESFYRECGLADKMYVITRDNGGFISIEKIIFGFPMLFEGFLVIRLIRLLWGLDGLEDQYHEHSQILCVLLILGIVLLATFILELIGMNPYSKDQLQIGMLVLWYYSVQGFMFWPRLWRACKRVAIKDNFLRQSYLERKDSGKGETESKSDISLANLGASNV